MRCVRAKLRPWVAPKASPASRSRSSACKTSLPSLRRCRQHAALPADSRGAQNAAAYAFQAISFIDVAEQRRRLGKRIDDAIARVLTHCQFINGPRSHVWRPILRLSAARSMWWACASGTDALLMVLLAKKIGPGDAVICPTFTFCATARSSRCSGATPVFVDVDETTFNIDIASLKNGIAVAKRQGSQAPGLSSPSTFLVSPPIMMRLRRLLRPRICSFWTTPRKVLARPTRGRRLGTFGLATATSFFPAKPLGCYGDGGAIFTDDAELADTLRSVRVHGQAI